LRVYLDANVLIAAFEATGARSDHAWWILDAIEAGEFVAVTSELTLAEVLVRPLQEGDDELARRYQEIVAPSSSIEVPVVDRRVLVEAAILRTMSRSLRLPDAIHVATARLAGCRHIISDDRRIPFAAEIKVVPLGPHALDVIRSSRA
jgi:predicted nucleic acid-binding protein